MFCSCFCYYGSAKWAKLYNLATKFECFKTEKYDLFYQLQVQNEFIVRIIII